MDVTTTNAGSASAGPIFHVAVSIVVTTAGIVVLTIGEVVQTGVVVTGHNLQRLAVETTQQAFLLIVLVAIAEDLETSLRGDRLDRVVGSTSFEVMSGQWGGIVFTPPTMNNVLSHVIMKGSSIGMHCSAKGDTTQCALKLINCVLTNSAATCLATEACYVELIGTEISDAASVVAYFNGGKVMASQCTFANYYLFEVPSWPIVYFDEDKAGASIA